MERVTISFSDEFSLELSQFMEGHGYTNRSEALRDLARLGLERARLERGGEPGDCVAALSYVFNHHTRELASRLTDAQHAHHDLHVATTHVHLDHENCLEVAILRGPTQAVTNFAKQVIAERGVAHGAVNVVPVEIADAFHMHGPDGRTHSHSHARPKS